MSALYEMKYQGVAGTGHGALYIGNGRVLGVDVTGARYEGTYTSEGTNLIGAVTLTSAGGALVTGAPVSPGTKVQIVFNFPADFAHGHFQTVIIGGQPARVALDKIGDIA